VTKQEKPRSITLTSHLHCIKRSRFSRLFTGLNGTDRRDEPDRWSVMKQEKPRSITLTCIR
jgi:hypothetical protein